MFSDVKKYYFNFLEFANIEPWIIQVFIVVFLTLLLSYSVKMVIRQLLKRADITSMIWDNALIRSAGKPLVALIWLLGIAYAAEIAGDVNDVAVFSLVDPAREIGFIVIITWFVVRFIKKFADNLIDKKLSEDVSFDRTTADAIVKLATISVIITAFLVILQSLGYSITGVLAFGGIGGIAVGFAARDLLANFFGGLMIYMDRPFALGDWIRSPDRDIEGTVEKIGWRLTQIRTFDKRPLYIPNYVFNTVSVENPSRMLNRRIFETVGIRYDDAAKMGAIVADVKEMLENHEEIDHGQTLMVNFDKFADSSLNFFIYTFTRTTVWTEYHRVKQDVLLKIIDIIEEHGAECAFPTTTVHMANGIPDEMEQENGNGTGSEKTDHQNTRDGDEVDGGSGDGE